MTESGAVTSAEDPPSSTDTSNNNKSNRQDVINSSSNKSVHLVFQRFRHCRLLLNEDTVIQVGKSSPSSSASENDIDNLLLNPHSTVNNSSDTAADTAAPAAAAVVVGLLVYVSFFSSATKNSVYSSAKTVLNLPIITLGSWGDGTATKSILQIAASPTSASPSSIAKDTSTTNETSSYHNVNLVIVPQANLISKVKSNGKSIQYHGQCRKDIGNELYEYFIQSVQDIATEYQATCRNEMETYNKHAAKKSGKTEIAAVDVASISPKEYFRYIDKESNKYGSYDSETGIPTTDSNGEPLTKSAIKKIRKLHESQCKRYDKYLEKQKKKEEEYKQQNQEKEQAEQSKDRKTETAIKDNNQSMEGGQVNDPHDNDDTTNNNLPSEYKLDPNFLHIVAGTFGKRQGLTMTSDMGPFCHVVQI